MQIKSELNKHIYSTVKSSSLSAIPVYQNHAPENTSYPVITFNFVSDNYDYSMGSNGNDYLKSRVQFNIFTNDQGFSDGITILNTIENTFHRKFSISLNNDVTMICSKVLGGSVTYFDSTEKIWHISEDFMFTAGK